MSAATSEEITLEGNPVQIERIPDSPSVPQHIEEAGVSPRATTFTAQVNDDKGQPLIHSEATSVTISVPGDEESLTKLSKGSISKAITWFAGFWLRVIKKAAYFGWRVIRKE